MNPLLQSARSVPAAGQDRGMGQAGVDQMQRFQLLLALLQGTGLQGVQGQVVVLQSGLQAVGFEALQQGGDVGEQAVECVDHPLPVGGAGRGGEGMLGWSAHA